MTLGHDAAVPLAYPDWLPPDDVEHAAYIAALNVLNERDTIPSAVLGVARYIVSPAPPSLVNRADVLATLPLVTADFWRAAGDVLDGFDWPVRHPNNVRAGTAGFGVQWDVVSRLFVVLQSASAEGSRRTDRERVEAAHAIVVAAKRLRTALDADTGHDASGDWLGLDALRARDLLNDAGSTRMGEQFGVMPSPTWHDGADAHRRAWRALDGLTLQDLLSEAIDRTEWQAEHVETDWHGRSRQARFVNGLRDWLQEAHVICCGTTTEGRYWPCVHTADGILGARHPEAPRVANPARARARP